MGPEKDKSNVRKIEVPTDTLQSLSWEIQLLTYREGGGEKQREREETQKQQREETGREEARRAETLQSQRSLWLK